MATIRRRPYGRGDRAIPDRIFRNRRRSASPSRSWRSQVPHAPHGSRAAIAEVAQDRRTQAGGGLRVCDHPPQLGVLERLPPLALLPSDGHATPPYVVLAPVVDQELTGADVGIRPEQRRGRRTAVAPGPSNLLVVRLDRAGDSITSTWPERTPELDYRRAFHATGTTA
jgi:hypothetical protein